MGPNYFQVGVDTRDTVGAQSSLVDQTIYVWGAQMEIGSSVSPYIPTTTAPVVRSADVCDITGSDFAGFYNQSEGTLFFEGDTSTPSPGNVAASINTSGAYDDSWYLLTGTVIGRAVIGNVFQCELSGTIMAANVASKQAIAIASNNFAAVRDGGTLATDLTGDVPTVNQLDVGSIGAQFILNGSIARLTYYPKRLSNQKIQSLTT
jgi:hypothetical protein